MASLNFRNLLAIIVTLLTFALIYFMGAGYFKFTDDLVKGVIIGGVMQWMTLVIQFYFRKRPAEEGKAQQAQ